MIIVKKTLLENESIALLNGWIGRVVESGTLSIEDVAKQISDTTMVTRADALGVLTALFEETEQALKAGYTVSLGDIGTLHLTVKNKMADTLDEWTLADNILGVRVRFISSVALRQAVEKGSEGVRVKVID